MIPSKPATWFIIASLLGLAGLGCLGRWGYLHHQEANLLTVDADTIPGRPQLMAFALDQAQPLYRRTCARCHGADLKGDASLGVPNLADRDWLYGAGGVADIEQTITYGIRSGDPKSRNLASMPAFGRPQPYARYSIPPLRPGEIRDVVEYLFLVEGRAADRAAAERGDRIYHTTGGCFDCHGGDAAGDGAIGAPNLTDGIWLYGDGARRAVFDSIAYGRAGACPAWLHQLKAAQIRGLALYVYAQAHPASGPGHPARTLNP